MSKKAAKFKREGEFETNYEKYKTKLHDLEEIAKDFYDKERKYLTSVLKKSRKQYPNPKSTISKFKQLGAITEIKVV